jgi:lipid-A-disaccharide synthase
VKELIQNDFNVGNIKSELELLLNNDTYRNQQLKDYQQLIDFLGGPGASKKIAKQIVEGIK